MNLTFTAEQINALESFSFDEKKPGKGVRIYTMPKYTPEEEMPLQLKQIARYMLTSKIKGTGTQIIQAMIDENLIVTKQSPAVLFAFYARRLENMGMVKV